MKFKNVNKKELIMCCVAGAVVSGVAAAARAIINKKFGKEELTMPAPESEVAADADNQ